MQGVAFGVGCCSLLSPPRGLHCGGGCKASGEVKVDALNVLGRVGDRMIHDSL